MGNQNDATTSSTVGFALMGAGSDLDEAFRFVSNKAFGGDFLVLRARGDEKYNSYVNGICHLNSVATLIIPDRQAAQEPRVADIIRHAEAPPALLGGGSFWHSPRFISPV